MRFKLDRSKTSITAINRGGIRVLPDADGVFDTDLYRDSITINIGSIAKTDTRYFNEVITEEQVIAAKKEVEDLVTYWESQGIAEILDKPKAKKAEKSAE